jgi:nitrogen fixation protein FixH
MSETHGPQGPSNPTSGAKGGMSDGKKFLLVFLAFFGVVFVADGIMIYLGTSGQDGLVEENYYQKGITYNDVIQVKKRQAELGWDFALSHPEKTGSGPLEVKLVDADGQPLTGKRVAALVRRPAQQGYDQNLSFEEVAPGTYRAEVSLPLQGLWDVKARIRDAQGEDAQDQAIFESRFTVSG